MNEPTEYQRAIDLLKSVTPENGTATKKRNAISYKTELNKSKKESDKLLILAMAGWSLAVMEFIVFLVFLFVR